MVWFLFWIIYFGSLFATAAFAKEQRVLPGKHKILPYVFIFGYFKCCDIIQEP